MLATIDQLIEPITEQQLEELLNLRGTSIDEIMKAGPDDLFAWRQGYHWFYSKGQGKGRKIYNRKLVLAWLVAKNLNAPEIHVRAIEEIAATLEGTKKRK